MKGLEKTKEEPAKPSGGEAMKEKRLIQEKEETITKLKQAEEELRQSEGQYRMLVETMHDGLAVQDIQGLLTYVNNRLCEMLGYSREELLGQPWKSLFDEEGLRILKEQMAQRERGERSTYEIPWRTKDGRTIYTLISGNPVHDADGKLVGSFGVITDITERKRTEEALRQSEREAAIRNQIAQIFLTIPDDEMYHEVLKVVLEAMESEYGVFGYIDENGALVVPSMTRHIWDQCQVAQKTFTFPRETWGDSTWPRAIREKRVIYVNEPSTKTPEGHIAIDRHISLPILYQDEVIGLFQVANKQTDYDENDIRLLQSIAEHIAPILNARLQRDRQEEARKQAEEELRQHRDHLEELVEERTAELTRQSEIISRQAQEILEISTPVMQVWEGVVVAPLIGMLDSQRTQRFMEVLLERIVETQSPIALVDITGVPTVDTQTAYHLIETISAVRLLGAQVVLTGVSPAIAQALVHLGVDLSGIVTRSSLVAGLRVALELLGLRMVGKE
jgi:PAS domain S-box-containing protein